MSKKKKGPQIPQKATPSVPAGAPATPDAAAPAPPATPASAVPTVPIDPPVPPVPAVAPPAPPPQPPNTIAEPCQRCGGMERTKPVKTNEHAYTGDDNGKPYTHLVWHISKCRGCGQSRMTKSFENRTA